MPNTPIQDGLYGFSTLSISDDPSRSVWAKAKFTSALNIKKGTPVIATAGNTLDRCAVTGGTNEVTTLTPHSGRGKHGRDVPDRHYDQRGCIYYCGYRLQCDGCTGPGGY